MIGTNLLHYRITEKLGEGGMGEVYRATDEKLGREVAIKLLPEGFADDPERLARFEREAKVLASLNHTNIAGIHELGESEASGTPVRFLAMELAEGEDLSQRIAHGPMPRDEALRLAVQIADALAAAHERGIVHRDLKPANVKVTSDGKVKVLDFGLAKEWAGPSGSSDMTHSPTLTARMTQAGTLLGTAAYMSPEQARGQEADRRADVWSFGLILVEMLTGRKAFDEPTVSDTLAAVLKSDPDLGALPAGTPPALRLLIERCLRKDANERLRDMGDIGLELRELLAGGDASVVAAAPVESSVRTSSRLMPFLAVAVAAAILGGLGVRWLLPGETGAPPPTRRSVQFAIQAPPGQTFVRGLAVSPDGSKIAVSLIDADTDRTAIWLRTLDSVELRKIDGTEDGRFPFWSPDGGQIGFFSDYALKVVDLIGSPPRALAPSADANDSRGGTWAPDGTILFSPAYTGPLMAISEQGGTPREATTIDPDGPIGTHRFPSMLPDGEHFLYYAADGQGAEPGELRLGKLGESTDVLLVESHSTGLFAEPDHLLYVSGDVLVRRQLDLAAKKVVGDPQPLGPRLPGGFAITGLRSLSLSHEGTLVYRVENLSRSRVVRVGRDGEEIGEPYDDETWHYGPAMSPDGRYFLISHYGAGPRGGDIWLYDLERGTKRSFMLDDADDEYPHWSPDGRRIVFNRRVGRISQLVVTSFENPGVPEVLLESEVGQYPSQWLPDGSGILMTRAAASDDILFYDLEKRELVDLIVTRFGERAPRVSPDGRWLAFESDVSGRSEIYVRPWGRDGQEWQASTEGGSVPRWSRDGETLYFVARDGGLSSVRTDDLVGAKAVAPERLFDLRLDLGQTEGGYFEAPDGTFIVNRRADEGDAPVIVVQPWQTLLDGSS